MQSHYADYNKYRIPENTPTPISKCNPPYTMFIDHNTFTKINGGITNSYRYKGKRENKLATTKRAENELDEYDKNVKRQSYLRKQKETLEFQED